VFISQPLAIVVIGGLASSTLLTLVLVPVLYVLAARRVEHEMPADPHMMTAATLPAIGPPVLRTGHARSSPRHGDMSGYFGS
jgi:hypothetical protein